MLTAFDADPKRLDQHEQKFVQRIRELGWFGTHVMPDDKGPGFSYTTGFWLKFGFPEVILFSRSRENAQDTCAPQRRSGLGGSRRYWRVRVMSG
jgi:hypothetical protein